MATLTLANIRSRVRRRVNEVSPSVGIGADSDVNDEINAAYDEIRQRIEQEDSYWFALKTTLTYTANSEFVTLPAVAQTNRILKVADTTDSSSDPRELWFISGADQYLYTRAPSKWYTVTTGGVTAPDYYTLAGQTIQLIPKPSGSRNLDIWYVPDKTDLVADGDVPIDIPAPYHDLIAWRAAQQILAYDRRASPAIDAKCERLEQLMLSLVNDRATGQGDFVRFIDIDRS